MDETLVKESVFESSHDGSNKHLVNLLVVLYDNIFQNIIKRICRGDDRCPQWLLAVVFLLEATLF